MRRKTEENSEYSDCGDNGVSFMKTYKELLVDLENLSRDINAARDHEAKSIAERVLALLMESGIDIRAIVNRTESRPRILRKVAAKYRDPKTGATWTGRGKTPRWLIGQDLTRFAIATETATDMESEQSRSNVGPPPEGHTGSKISAD
ncbi:H-NS histone family protein [Burkholderia diffusa]|uniref:H-NS histone family protein n=1 Tax=Burkholderia diffusa TaxID=488732 RepID=UPI001E44A7B5|nr:H-NS histone family protein [Burkholderia diffusa]